MTPQQAAQEIERRVGKLQHAIANDLPRIVGKHAVDFYQENFVRGGFLDESLERWKPAKRLGQKNGVAGTMPTLLSKRKELYNSIHFIPRPGAVTIRSAKPYSRIQNEGGVTHPTVTPKMRRFAWAQHYRMAGDKPNANTMWKNIALTRKQTLTVVIPKRQFMGHSATLNRFLQTEVNNHVRKIILP